MTTIDWEQREWRRLTDSTPCPDGAVAHHYIAANGEPDRLTLTSRGVHFFRDEYSKSEDHLFLAESFNGPASDESTINDAASFVSRVVEDGIPISRIRVTVEIFTENEGG